MLSVTAWMPLKPCVACENSCERALVAGHRNRCWTRSRVYAWVDDLTNGGPMETAIFDADSHLMETPEWLGRLRRGGGP